MDRKSVIILLLSFVLLVFLMQMTNKWFPPIPKPPGQAPFAAAGRTNAEPAAAPAVTNDSAAPGAAQAHPATLPAPLPPQFIPTSAEPEQLITNETDQLRYVFTSHGGGLKRVELVHYPETVGRQARRGLRTNEVATLNEGARLPVLALSGAEALQDDGVYTLTQVGNAIRAEKHLASGLRVIKEFQPASNYVLSASVRLENTTSSPLTLPPQELLVGTATPISPYDAGTLMRVMWFDGLNASKVDQTWFANAGTFACIPGCGSGIPRTEYLAASSNIVWVSAQNQFFTLLLIPPTNAPAAQLAVRHLDLPPPPAAALQEDRQLVAKPFAFQTSLLYPGAVLAPGASLERQYNLFTGPKEYRTLDRLAHQFRNEVDRVMDFGGFFGFFSKALLLSMNGFHAIGLSYGLAIIAITIIIKLLFWPLTQASTRSMKRMAALQPKMKEIQEKYKDDPKKMNEKTMLFMKEHRINPAAGCLPILIQIPVFMGFYYMLQSAIELRGARFLWAFDLSQPDTIFLLPLLGGLPVNPLPVLMGLTQFWQMKLTPPSPGMDPVQQKIFQFMPLLFIGFLYNFSSGLTLYWTVQNLLSIAQMKLTKSTGEEKPPAAPAVRPTPATPRKRK